MKRHRIVTPPGDKFSEAVFSWSGSDQDILFNINKNNRIFYLKTPLFELFGAGKCS